MILKFGPSTSLQYLITAPLVLMLVKFWRHEFSAENDEIARSVVFFLSLFSLIYLGDRVRERICSWTEKRGQVREGP